MPDQSFASELWRLAEYAETARSELRFGTNRDPVAILGIISGDLRNLAKTDEATRAIDQDALERPGRMLGECARPARDFQPGRHSDAIP